MLAVGHDHRVEHIDGVGIACHVVLGVHDLGAGAAEELAEGLVLFGGDRGVRFGEPSEPAPSREIGGNGSSDEHPAERRDERLSPEGRSVVAT